MLDLPRSWDRYIPLMEFSYNNSYQSSIGIAPYEALYGRKVRVIQQRLKYAIDRQNLYAYLKRKDIEYEIEDKVFLKVSPWRKVLRFRKKGKPSPRFFGPYEILERIKPIAYRLALPPELAKLHNVFHVSMLRKYRSNESHVLSVQDVQVHSNFSFDEKPKAILAHEVKRIRNKQVPLVKVLWQHHGMEEATWEPELTMRAQYSQLFNSYINFEDEILLRGGEL